MCGKPPQLRRLQIVSLICLQFQMSANNFTFGVHHQSLFHYKDTLISFSVASRPLLPHSEAQQTLFQMIIFYKGFFIKIHLSWKLRIGKKLLLRLYIGMNDIHVGRSCEAYDCKNRCRGSYGEACKTSTNQ